MSKLSGLVLVAALSLGLASTGANAAFVPPRGAPPAHDGNSDPCIVLCTPPDTVDRLVIVTNGDDCGPKRELAPVDRQLGTNVPPGLGKCASVAKSRYQDCGAQLSNLKRVTVGQVRRIDEQDAVHLVPLCDVVHRSLTQQDMHYLASGNVQGLIPAISRNDTLMNELEDNGYRAENVIGIAVAPHVATLYVSRGR